MLRAAKRWAMYVSLGLVLGMLPMAHEAITSPATLYAAEPIDLNTATVDQLKELSGIGEAGAGGVASMRGTIRP